MAPSVDIEIITCPQWDAKTPRGGVDSIIWTPGPAKRTIFHHTASHHAEIENPRDTSREEAIRYAQDIQRFHMGAERGWIDSGHNFLVLRGGPPGRGYAWILQGRWRTVRAIQDGKMVVSAHCPGQNDQIGIEHEHKGSEPMTPEQREASALLQAWIAWGYRRDRVLPSRPHSLYVNTDCPANLRGEIDRVNRRAQEILDTSVSAA